MSVLRVRNWAKWQTYRRDRGQPPWIKVHRALLRDPEFVALTDAQRGQLVVIWLLAADRDGVIPASPALIQKLCYMDEKPDLQVFVAQGFLIDDANVTPTGRQTDANVTPQSRGEEIREEQKPPVVPLDGGREQKKAKKRKSTLPEDWQPNDSHRDRAKRESLNLEREVEKFRSHAEATGRLLKSWDAGFTAWMLNAKEFNGRANGVPPDSEAAQWDAESEKWREQKRRMRAHEQSEIQRLQTEI